jgi:hypothetical protein
VAIKEPSLLRLRKEIADSWAFISVVIDLS